MQVIPAPAAMQQWSAAARSAGRSIGFVPTMGALHAGHTFLLDRARDENDVTVLSVFVNPLQFNERNDFERYPRTIEDDLALARQHGVDCVFLPSADDMYPPDASVRVLPGSVANGMEGDMRPGHFEGVTTVVAKLFNCVQPHRAYFGRKDYQQLAVISQMVDDLNFGLDIVAVDTVREPDGLALSSRNVRLLPADREQATVIHRSLSAARSAHASGCTDASTIREGVLAGLATADRARVEYVAVVDPVTLRPVSTTTDGAVVCVATWFGNVRLIDNVELPRP